ncbi:MAG: hypothetical protein IPH22_13025 [Nitrosomonas sp.]|nr:hypothetical protein [Nitrosomonas sp.]
MKVNLIMLTLSTGANRNGSNIEVLVAKFICSNTNAIEYRVQFGEAAEGKRSVSTWNFSRILSVTLGLQA